LDLLMGLGLKVNVGHVLGLEHDLGLGVDPSYKPCWDHISDTPVPQPLSVMTSVKARRGEEVCGR